MAIKKPTLNEIDITMRKTEERLGGGVCSSAGIRKTSELKKMIDNKKPKFAPRKKRLRCAGRGLNVMCN